MAKAKTAAEQRAYFVALRAEHDHPQAIECCDAMLALIDADMAWGIAINHRSYRLSKAARDRLTRTSENYARALARCTVAEKVAELSQAEFAERMRAWLAAWQGNDPH